MIETNTKFVKVYVQAGSRGEFRRNKELSTVKGEVLFLILLTFNTQRSKILKRDIRENSKILEM